MIPAMNNWRLPRLGHHGGKRGLPADAGGSASSGGVANSKRRLLADASGDVSSSGGVASGDHLQKLVVANLAGGGAHAPYTCCL